MKLVVLNLNLFIFTLLFFFAKTAVFANELPENLNRVFIVDCKTTGQYGLYSYFLFSRQPVFNAHTRALKQMERLLRDINRLKQHYPLTPTDNQQTIYIPVSFEPQTWVTQPTEDDYDAAARWVLHNFDFQCNKKLLDHFPKIKGNGPYILSTAQKIQLTSPWRIPVLVQNLSTAKLAESLFWFDTFFKKSEPSQSWGTMELLSLQENMLTLMLERYHTKMQKTLQTSRLSPVTNPLHRELPKPLQTELKMVYPINKSPWIKNNPYLNKITIQFKREK